MDALAQLPIVESGAVIASVLLVAGGIVFIVIWFSAAAAWAAMSLMGTAMANDSGRVSAEKHASLILTMIVGQAVVALAGIPGGLAFFWADLRAVLIWVFAGLFVAGVGIQVRALWSFSKAAS